jgi:hypothetical protein
MKKLAMGGSERDLPCNFLEYLEWRLGEKPDAATRLLGEWLASYEPKRAVAAPEAPEPALGTGVVLEVA